MIFLDHSPTLVTSGNDVYGTSTIYRTIIIMKMIFLCGPFSMEMIVLHQPLTLDHSLKLLTTVKFEKMTTQRGGPFCLTTSQSDFQGEWLSYTTPPHWPQGQSLSMVHQQSVGPFYL